MEGKSSKSVSLRRCAAWLKAQSAEPRSMIAVRLPDVDVDAHSVGTLPTAVDEDEIIRTKVPLRKLRTDGLRMECEWRGCRYVTGDYDQFQRHVRVHIPQLQIVEPHNPKYKCLWDICRHQSADGREMVRHINYHAYHSKLMAVGDSAQFSLKLPPCRRDSTRRNQLPVQPNDYCCRWVGCTETFTAYQDLLTHIALHVQYCEGRCSWAGCGAVCDTYMKQHVRSHSRERLVACAHCGVHLVTNVKLQDHLQRQNVPAGGAYRCDVCGREKATERLLRMHARQHVCVYACTYCDMTTQTLSALSVHIRFRHLAHHPGNKPFKCDVCTYSCITKSDLRRHIATHYKVKKPARKEDPDAEECALFKKPEKAAKKYICHMCPDGTNKIFSRGTRLTTHLVKEHGAQWPDGHCRFRYQKSDDGLYRLTTMRYESLEVSHQIMRGSNPPKEPVTEGLSVRMKKKSSATRVQPIQYAVDLKCQDSSDSEPDYKLKEESLHEELILPKDEIHVPEAEPPIEITMCDVDEEGNVIRSEVVDSDDVIIGL